ncbi:MAG TPA: hypothetical protein VKZ54_01825 [Membranihabitans sp.]|nr:hypothetical protein [Membranihabitans sp.]
MFGIQKIESDIREGLLSRSRILLLVPVVLIILAALAFFPSLSNDFQRQWDDQWMLLEHHIILHPSLENIWYYFTHFDRGQYYPLNQLYYLGIHSLFGFDPAAFHAGSLIMHLINSILVFILIRQIGRQIVEPEHHFRLHWMAGLVALIFAIHPLQVESVAWISASKILLYATFTLSGLITYVIYIKSRKVVFLILTILAYILSFMCKEQAIILPLNIILLDWLFHTFGYREFSKRVLWEKIPFFVLALFFWYWSVQNNLGVLEVSTAYPWHQRLIFGSYSLIIYIIRFLVPVNLLYFYGYPIVTGESLSWFYISYAVLAFLFLLYMSDLYRRKQYIPFFGLTFFLIYILLVLHIIPMPRYMITADRYMYLSVVGLSVWIIWVVYRLVQWAQDRTWLRFGIVGSIMLVLSCFVIYSNTLTRKWSNSITIKQEVQEYLAPEIQEINSTE